MTSAATPTPPATFGRRLLFVTGKGGVGKTTVACAIASAAARRGRRVLLLAAGTLPDAGVLPAEVTLRPVGGRESLDEYLRLALPLAIARRVTRSHIYQRFVAAAPGLRELMMLGKMAHEARSDEWDLVVVDAPSTGHALQLFRMPAGAAAAFGGLVRSEADRVLAQLRDPSRTMIVTVTLPEELAVNETIELHAALETLELPIGPIVVNRVRRAPAAAAKLSQLAGGSALARAVLRAGAEEAGWAAIHAHQLERLAAASDRPRILLPFLSTEALGRTELDLLQRELP
jgi:anion-transporting  ArsA/GET3 family ATPase